MSKSPKAKESSSQQTVEEVKKIIDEFVKDDPRLEFADSADLYDAREAAIEEQDLADIYRKHLGLLDPN